MTHSPTPWVARMRIRLASSAPPGSSKPMRLWIMKRRKSYTVSVSVSDGNGESDSITVTINVTDVNETGATVSTNITTCFLLVIKVAMYMT